MSKILIVLDVHEDFRQGHDEYPIEVEKALRFVSDKTASKLILVGCGFEEYLHDSYSSFAKDEVDNRKQFVQTLEDRLAKVVSKLSDNGYQVESKVLWAYPRFEKIAQEAESANVDLVIQHVNSNVDTEHPVLSNDSWQLVRSCKKSVLLVRDKAWPSKPNLMAAVDPTHNNHKLSQLDHKIMDSALSAKADLGGELHVVHACSADAHIFTSAEVIVEKHQTALDEFISQYDIDSGNVHLSKEKPIYALLNYKKELQVDVIIMGVISKSRLAETMVGNTAQGVLDYLKADVMVVRPSA